MIVVDKDSECCDESSQNHGDGADIDIVVVRADIEIDGVDEANEFNIGGYVQYNDDDDDNDGVADVDDGYDKDGEDCNDANENTSENDFVYRLRGLRVRAGEYCG